jgi:hypothetical protein
MEWDPDIHPRGPDGKFISIATLQKWAKSRGKSKRSSNRHPPERASEMLKRWAEKRTPSKKQTSKVSPSPKPSKAPSPTATKPSAPKQSAKPTEQKPGQKAATPKPAAQEHKQAAPKPSSKSEAVHDRILSAFDEVNSKLGRGKYVTVHALRQKLPDVPREKFDESLNKLRRDWKLTLDPSDGRHDRVSDDVLKSGIKEENHTLVYVARRNADDD